MTKKHSFDYRGLWKLLIEKRLSRAQLQAGTGLSNNVMNRLANGEGVSLETLARICDYADCGFSDLQIEVLRDDNTI
ncbi:helix-turn-helix transcriptional regulator [uncultured Corynebacterium sp.]|uniref:helix-turn-helix domain-containing protein n=1 Tax=uncultured Corynebacterium sp. TaxID=159447 RepID=UPI00344D3FAE